MQKKKMGRNGKLGTQGMEADLGKRGKVKDEEEFIHPARPSLPYHSHSFSRRTLYMLTVKPDCLSSF